MAEIILDISANTHKNDWKYLKRMLDELKAIDTGKHKIIIKHQLFMEAGKNIPLSRGIFNRAYEYAQDLGYQTTSSVFDKASLDLLLNFDIPFVKIANNRELDWLVGDIPRKIPVYMSIGRNYKVGDTRIIYDNEDNFIKMACISKYPAKVEEYENNFNQQQLREHISDHTTNWDLFKKYNPRIIEMHYKLEDSYGLDAGTFARTPAQLAEVL